MYAIKYRIVLCYPSSNTQNTKRYIKVWKSIDTLRRSSDLFHELEGLVIESGIENISPRFFFVSRSVALWVRCESLKPIQESWHITGNI